MPGLYMLPLPSHNKLDALYDVPRVAQAYYYCVRVAGSLSHTYNT